MTPVTLSASRVSPGDPVTIEHASISVARPVDVTFTGPGGLSSTVQVLPGEDGRVVVAAPPVLDPETYAFDQGEVTVSVPGAGEQTLEVGPLPALADDVAPGAIVLMTLEASIASFQSAIEKYQTAPVAAGVDVSAAVAALTEQVSALQEMAGEIEASGTLTVQTDAGAVELSGDDLLTVDRVLLSYFQGLASFEQTDGSVARTLADDTFTADDAYEIFRSGLRAARGSIPALQTLASYVALTCGAGAVVLVGSAAGGVATTVAVAVTAVTTVGAAGVSIVSDLALDFANQRDPDFDRALDNAGEVAWNGLQSILLTAAGGVEWVGAQVSSLASALGDGWTVKEFAVENFCSDDATAERLAARASSDEAASTDEFCQQVEVYVIQRTCPDLAGSWGIQTTSTWACVGPVWEGGHYNTTMDGSSDGVIEQVGCSYVLVNTNYWGQQDRMRLHAEGSSVEMYGWPISINDTTKGLNSTGTLSSVDGTISLYGEGSVSDVSLMATCDVQMSYDLIPSL